MGDSNRMPDANNLKGGTQLKKSEIDFMRIVNQKNLERVQKLKTLRRKNLITASCLTAGVFGIYIYSMVSVKQETFLDDFNEPEKVRQ